MNAVRKDIPEPTRRTLARVLRESIDYGLAHRKEALDHAMKYARGLDRKRADAFVGMYVNEWTRELGPNGRKAVELFLGEAVAKDFVPAVRIEYQER